MIGAVLTSPEVSAELIADGVHVDEAAMRLLLQAKSAGGVVLISDGICATGMPDGKYMLGKFEVTVSGGVCRNAEGRLAGSTLTLDRALRNVVALGVPLQDAVRMLTANPAKLLGIEFKKGALRTGADADVVLLDVVMPGRSGLDAVAEIKEAAPKAEVLVLSMQDDPSYVREAFAAGSSGYVLKDAADTELVTAVREVAAGRRYVHPTLGARLAAAEADAVSRAAADPLSEREREVLRLLALGHTNQEIAKMLYISVRTAETHRAHIMQKLRLTTRAELVRHALRQGLLDESET